MAFDYGLRRYAPVAGDWDGNGTQRVGAFDKGTWYLRNSDDAGAPNVVINYGGDGYTPSSGTGTATAPTPSASTADGGFYLRNSNTAGDADLASITARRRRPSSATGTATAPTRSASTATGQFFLRNSNTPGTADITVNYGAAGYLPSSATGTATAPTPSASTRAAGGISATQHRWAPDLVFELRSAGYTADRRALDRHG